MDTIKKAHPYLRKCLLIFYLLSFVCLAFFIYTQHYFYLYSLIGCLIAIGLIYTVVEKRQKQQLEYLIHNADAIIDQKPLDIIDGEGEISLLSHKLYILNKRYYSLLEKMKQEQIELKDYIENISHQLKTPITSMRLNEELLLETMKESKQKEKIEQIYIQTLKMNQLVNDLLTLALLDSQSIELKYNHYPIEILIEDIEEDLDYLLQEKQMRIQLHHHQESILCDKKWMEEALKNILKNHIEKNQGSIIDVFVDETESLTQIVIQDHGKGFLEEDIPHLFERFYRGKKKDYQGIGIGLALSKEIIEQHHGLIKARNQQGACIDISIPKLLAKKKI